MSTNKNGIAIIRDCDVSDAAWYFFQPDYADGKISSSDYTPVWLATEQAIRSAFKKD